MKGLFCLFISLMSIHLASAQDGEKFVVHRSLKVVGMETYKARTDEKGLTTYTIDCNYTDRGTEVPLKASVVMSSSTDPKSIWLQGKTSRTQLIDDSIYLDKQNAFVKQNSLSETLKRNKNSFPIDGYAPATLQWLLIKFWQQTGKPPVIDGLPNGNIRVKEMGKDTMLVNGSRQVFQAYAIHNVIWGWEFLWTDMEGKLAALNTINAEGDKIEFINEKYIDILQPIAGLSARNGVSNYPKPAASKNPVAILDASVLNIETGEATPLQTVICTDGIITWMGADDKAVIPANATIIKAAGRYLLPGLWDMHAHVKQPEWGPAYIAAGITTVRDMGNEFAFINSIKKSIDAGTGIGPTLLRAGIIDGTGARTNGIELADTPEEAIAMVHKYKNAGYQQVKLYSTLSAPMVPIICKEAKRLNLTIAGHIPISMTLMEALENGLEQVSHLTFVSNALKYDRASFEINYASDSVQQIIKYLKDHKIVIDPTLAIYELITRSLDDSITNIEPAFYSLPKTLQSQLITMGLKPEEAEKRKAWFNMHLKLLRILAENDVPIVAGTDMLIPGYSLYRELELYVAAGLSPLQALQTATMVPAKVMNRYADAGSVTVGKKADLILVDGNPVTQISNIRKVDRVIKAGEVYQPKEVHRLIGFE